MPGDGAQTEALIAIGSNIEPEQNIPLALERLSREIRIRDVSAFYWSEAVGRAGQARFLNGACAIITSLRPRALKYDMLRGIERAMGRIRTSDKYAARAIDLDIALYGNESIDEEGLLIPDPDISARPFLAIPLAELAPDWSVPGLHVTLSGIAAACEVRQLTRADALSRQLKEKYSR